MNDTPISSLRQLVDRFGGTGKFADFLHIVPSAVSNMLSQGRLPPGYHLEVYLECERQGWAVDQVAIFGLEPEKVPRKKNPKRRAEARVA